MGGQRHAPSALYPRENPGTHCTEVQHSGPQYSIAGSPWRLNFVWQKNLKCTLIQSLRLCTGRTAHRGSRGITLLFLDHGTRRGWVVSVTPRPPFTPGKSRYPLYRRLGDHRGRSGRVRKISPPPGFDSRTVQPVASHYTDCATRSTNSVWWHLIYLSSQYGPCLTSPFWCLKVLRWLQNFCNMCTPWFIF